MRLFCIVLLSALPAAIFAQSNYHQGYVLKNTGDTLKGYIDYREWERTPKSIQFKENESDKNILEFDPQTIKAFGITNMEYYISYTGIISMDKTQFPDIPVGLDTNKMLKTIFLKKVTTGKHLTLYQQKDDTKSRFFISERNGPITELKYYQYYSDGSNVIESARYKGQLIYYINQFDANDKSLINFAARTQFIENNLKTIVDKINGEGSTVNSTRRSKEFRLFAGVGVNYTQGLYDDTYYHLSSATVFPKVNGGLDVFINPNVQQLILRAELSLSYNNPKLAMPYGEVYSFSQYTLGITPQIVFNVYNKDALKVYIDGGLSFNFSAYSDNIISFAGTTAVEKSPYKLEPYWANFPLQAGIVVNKKLEFALTYTGAAAYTKYADLSVANRTIGAGFKYLF